MKNGAADYLALPLTVEEVRLVVESCREDLNRNMELDYLRDRFWKVDWLKLIHTRNAVMKRIYENTRSVSPTKGHSLILLISQ